VPTKAAMLKKSALVILTSRTNPDACRTKRPLDEADFAIRMNPFLVKDSMHHASIKKIKMSEAMSRANIMY
jgi:hypothetical protein